MNGYTVGYAVSAALLIVGTVGYVIFMLRYQHQTTKNS